MKKNNIPKVKIEKLDLIENNYINNGGRKWSALKLIEHSKQFETFDLPLIGVDLSSYPWNIQSIDDFCYHVKRVMNTDLKHPILLDDYGRICDGFHRVSKAILLGKTHIKAIRLESMPEPDSFEPKTNENE